MVFAVYQQGVGCGEPPKMKNSQRCGSVNAITYQCDEGYTEAVGPLVLMENGYIMEYVRVS